MIEQKKKVEEDKIMVEEDKRQIATKFEERSSNVQKLTNTHLDMMNHLILTNQELNRRDMEIENLRSQSDQLRSELRYEKEVVEIMNKPSKAIIYFKDLMR